MPNMEDPNFRQTLTYIVEHNDNGALGFVVNRSMGIDIGEVYQQMDISLSDNPDLATPVLEGGPVDREHGLVLHPSGQSWSSTKDFGHGVALSSSRDILEDMARGEGPQRGLVLLGHSGWGPGQLEDEFAGNAWLSCPAASDILFDTGLDAKLDAAAAHLGINLQSVVTDAGHA